MKIAQVAPLHESVPPQYYGGTERVVSYLTESLVRLGHEVTLYASGDSETAAELRAVRSRAVRLDPVSIDPIADHILLIEKVFQEAGEFDFIHSHIDYLPYPLFRRLKIPHVTTLHGRLDIPDLQNLYQEFSDMPVISISDAQRVPLFWANWQTTVYHGVPEDLYALQEKPGKYLAVLGRFSPEKRVDWAIQIARKAGMPLKIAAKIAKADEEYFQCVIKPLLNDPNVEFVGEIKESEKQDFLGNAAALLFPIDWPEPFGLVMIESLACGTPVIARPVGSAPEILIPGVTGFFMQSIEDGAKAVSKVSSLSRRTCREIFEKRFTALRMARDYFKIYQKLIEDSQKFGKAV